jgi:uracil-DNA glycosylase family 4
MKDCRMCPLRNGCNQVVTGVGNFNSLLFIIGEYPGADEDLEGEPFVGRAGDLLTKLLNKVGISREDIYISSTIKCRPLPKTSPKPEEIQICKTWLWKEMLALTNMKVILPLGAMPTGLLLKTSNIVMKSVVGREFIMPYTSAKIMPWYHPNYILRRNKKLIECTLAWFKRIKESL